MKKLTALTLMIFTLQTISVFAQNYESITDAYFSTIKYQNDTFKIRQFVSKMPKGGNLHIHFTGAIPVETYLQWAEEGKMFCDTLTILKTQGHNNVFVKRRNANCISIDELRQNSRLLGKWSIEGYKIPYDGNINVKESSLHFFNVPNFGAGMGAKGYRGGFEVLKTLALQENVQYLECMYKVPPELKTSLPSFCNDSLSYYLNKKDTINACRLLLFIINKLDNDTANLRILKSRILETSKFHEGIDDSLFTLRFQIYVARGGKNIDVLKNLYACFKLVSIDMSQLFVGVNIVGPENDSIAIKNYWLHMQMFKILKQRYPSVLTSMHAGELVSGLVDSSCLRFHINDAIKIAQANRIGHGVDIAFEDNMANTLNIMKTKGIPVEINLTSNEFILGIGIGGKIHPITLYFDSGVPIVISSDDPGISKSDLTNEYFKLATKYPFSYKQMKTFIYNSIKYSFLNEIQKERMNNLLSKRFAKFEFETATKSNNDN